MKSGTLTASVSSRHWKSTSRVRSPTFPPPTPTCLHYDQYVIRARTCSTWGDYTCVRGHVNPPTAAASTCVLRCWSTFVCVVPTEGAGGVSKRQTIKLVLSENDNNMNLRSGICTIMMMMWFSITSTLIFKTLFGNTNASRVEWGVCGTASSCGGRRHGSCTCVCVCYCCRVFKCCCCYCCSLLCRKSCQKIKLKRF